MNLHTPLALACVLAFAGCKKEQQTSPPASPQPPAAQKAPVKPAAAPPTATSPAPKATPKLPTAAELTALIDRATRIEAKSGAMQKPKWSKDLPPEDVANLKAGIGEATFSTGAPRCLPSVIVTLYEKEQVLATLGGFCASGNPTGLMRFDINNTTGSLTVQDIARVNAALESPVDR